MVIPIHRIVRKIFFNLKVGILVVHVVETHMLETHYLDIDADRTYNPDQKENGGWYEYQTMTGGVYHLPIRNADRVLLCNYITYDNAESIAQVCDYRFVKFLSEGEQTQ